MTAALLFLGKIINRMATDFYCKTPRSLLGRINEVGAKPFALFLYYLTYQTAPEIKPSLKRTARDLGMFDKKGNPQISAVSHLKRILMEKGWIDEIDGVIFITIDSAGDEKNSKDLRKSQTFTPDEDQKLEKISNKVEKISNDDLRKSQQNLRKSQVPIYRNENKQEITQEKDQKRENRGNLNRAKCEPNSRAPSFNFSRFFVENEFGRIFSKFYPNIPLTKTQTETITNRIRDGDTFKKALQYWTENNYRAESIGKICDKHDEILTEGTNKNGIYSRDQRTDEDVFRESAQFYAEWEAREAANFAN